MLWLALSATAVVAGAALISPVLAATFVYVSNSESNDIYVWQLNRQTGELTLIETVTIPGIIKSGGSTPMAVSPDRRFLYVATRGEPQADASFLIDPKMFDKRVQVPKFCHSASNIAPSHWWLANLMQSAAFQKLSRLGQAKH